MASSQRILVIVDPTISNEQVCVDRAAWLADELGLGVELFICYYEKLLVAARSRQKHYHDSFRQFAIEQQRKKLEEVAAPLRDKGIDVIVSAVWDSQLGDGIIRQVLRTDPCLVIKDTHYHNAIRRALFKHTDWHLVRKCPAPLWLTKPHEWAETPQIVASVDPTHAHDEAGTFDEKILYEAERLESILQGKLHVYHGYTTIDPVGYAAFGAGIVPGEPLPVEELTKNIQNDHRDKLNSLLDKFSVAEDRVHMVEGPAEKILPDFSAKLNADLIVMGAIARNSIHRAFVGSTTEKVLDKLPCDLLIVKPDWFTTTMVASEPKYYDGTREHLPAAQDKISEELERLRH